MLKEWQDYCIHCNLKTWYSTISKYENSHLIIILARLSKKKLPSKFYFSGLTRILFRCSWWYAQLATVFSLKFYNSVIVKTSDIFVECYANVKLTKRGIGFFFTLLRILKKLWKYKKFRKYVEARRWTLNRSMSLTLSPLRSSDYSELISK